LNQLTGFRLAPNSKSAAPTGDLLSAPRQRIFPLHPAFTSLRLAPMGRIFRLSRFASPQTCAFSQFPPARLFMKPPACAVCTIVSLLGGHSSLLLRFLVHAACAAWSIAALARILVLSAKFAANFRLSPLISPSTQLLIRYRFPTRPQAPAHHSGRN